MYKLSPGDVIRVDLGDDNVFLYICLCNHEYWFLRIGPKDLWKCGFPLHANEVTWSDRDCYVELNQVHKLPKPAVDAAMYNRADVIGRWPRFLFEPLIDAIQSAPTIETKKKEYIESRLRCGDEIIEE